MKIFGMVTTKDSSEYTYYALSTFFQETTLEDGDLFFLIDNDHSFIPIGVEYEDRIIIIHNQVPQGFAQNVNLMINQALLREADLFFLNNDIIFTPGWIEPLLIESQSILSPLSNREVQYTAENFSIPVSLSLSDYQKFSDKMPQILEFHKQKYSGYHQVLALPFFCIKLPYAVVDKVGFLDERFGRGGAEDYDYCLRCNLENINVRYATSSFILHFGGKSSWSGPEDKTSQLHRELLFKTKFEEKWGKDLSKILFYEDHSIINNNHNLKNLIDLKNYKAAVQELMQLSSVDCLETSVDVGIG